MKVLEGFEKFRKTKKGLTRFEKLQQLHDMLPVGSEHAVSKEFVAAMWHTKNTRVARKIMTEEMPKAGLPVCNHGGGYFVPINSEEMQPSYDWYHAYYKSTQQGFYYRKKMLEAMKKRERIEGVKLSPLVRYTSKHKQRQTAQRKSSAVGL